MSKNFLESGSGEKRLLAPLGGPGACSPENLRSDFLRWAKVKLNFVCKNYKVSRYFLCVYQSAGNNRIFPSFFRT